ncbi:MAG TPA: heme-copper oxidase subunit III [Acidimicrobiales bacterium]|jgi:cytochrome c oxidase subunit 3|nr:heme-copper oxidase subunit III [Acidimicrobiales bacterium]
MTQAMAARRQALFPTERRPNLLSVGVMVWLGSELMFFSGLFAAYYTIRAHAVTWPPPGDHLDVLEEAIFTFILVMSSVTMQKAVYEEEQDRRTSARWWVLLSWIMGAVFVLGQALDWAKVPFSASTDAFGSLFFVMTGIHGLHVILGLVAMIGLMGRMVGPSGDPGERQVFQAVSYYWHFVDIVWIGLYCSIFLVH